MTPEQRAVLVSIRDDLTSGKIPPEKFDMAEWGGPYCGTAHCIGGHMALRLRTRRMSYKQMLEALSLDEFTGLFYGLYSGECLSDLTAAQAIAAIDRFLAGNTERPWAEDPS